MNPDPDAVMLASPARWADAHRADALDLVRIYLGLGLLVRGAVFLTDPVAFTSLLPGGAESPYASFLVTNYVALAHLAGGLLLTLGMATRVAAAVQLPILAGAAFLVHLPTEGPFSQSFGFAAFVLVLLVVFVVFGGGRWSLDRAVDRWSAEREAEEADLVAATARELRARPRLGPAPERQAAAGVAEPGCTCGHDRDHPRVAVEREYGGLRGLRFMTGTHARPTRATYRCADCGGVVAVVEDADELEALRYLRRA